MTPTGPINGETPTVYDDNSFSGFDGITWASGDENTYTAVATDSLGRSDTNSVTVYLTGNAKYSYDLNGNLLSDGVRGYDYDDENQLVRVTVTNSWKSEFAYDGRMRRRIRKEYSWNGSGWDLQSETRYVYDANLVVQERDGSNLPRVTYTRGLDLAGTLQDAGGIGGLLGRTEHALFNLDSAKGHAYYHADAGGNVTALINDKQAIVASYLYDPYGVLLGLSGPLAEVNLYRFSSKEFHENSGLYYYGYRYYEPALQRWVNRDPLEEEGGVNLYNFVANDPMNWIDLFGLLTIVECKQTQDDDACWVTAADHYCGKIPKGTLKRKICEAGISAILKAGGFSGKFAECDFSKKRCEVCCADKYDTDFQGETECQKFCQMEWTKCKVGVLGKKGKSK